MCLGALVDAGLSLKDMEKELRKLPVKGYSLSAKKVRRSNILATGIAVSIEKKSKGKKKGKRQITAAEQGKGRRWKDIRGIIKASTLSENIKQKGLQIFRRLFEAEAKVHGRSFKYVHLHELGAVDCLIDVFGTLIGLELLGVGAVYSSPVNLGGGAVDTAHGILPVPAPATAEILCDVPVYSSGIPFELTTPTGAVILKSLSERFGGMPFFIPEKIGLGAGGKDLEGRPNVLRILIGNIPAEPVAETVTVIETNIDDMNPQIYEYLIERLFGKGALDVFMTQVIMKKMRPGIKLSILCENAGRNDLVDVVFRETTSTGVRFYEVSRITMDRRFTEARTRFGKVRVKVAAIGNEDFKSMPEYEDCRIIAKTSRVPLLDVINEAGRSAINRK